MRRHKKSGRPKWGLPLSNFRLDGCHTPFAGNYHSTGDEAHAEEHRRHTRLRDGLRSAGRVALFNVDIVLQMAA